MLEKPRIAALPQTLYHQGKGRYSQRASLTRGVGTTRTGELGPASADLCFDAVCGNLVDPDLTSPGKGCFYAGDGV